VPNDCEFLREIAVGVRSKTVVLLAHGNTCQRVNTNQIDGIRVHVHRAVDYSIVASDDLRAFYAMLTIGSGWYMAKPVHTPTFLLFLLAALARPMFSVQEGIGLPTGRRSQLSWFVGIVDHTVTNWSPNPAEPLPGPNSPLSAARVIGLVPSLRGFTGGLP
jgi:hypothetical protein